MLTIAEALNWLEYKKKLRARGTSGRKPYQNAVTED